MRTSLWISVALLLAVALAGTTSSVAMRGLSQRYVSAAEELYLLTEQEDWTRAAETASACHADWQRRIGVLQMLINHDDTDDVTMALVTLKAAIAAQDRAGCMDSCVQLKEHALHLYHRDAFTLENVL